MGNVHRLLRIAFIEWKIQLRSILFWVCLTVLLVYSLGRLVGASPETAFLPRQWLETREDSLTWLSLGLIFLVPSALGRDQRTSGLVWTRPFSSTVYAGGKLLGLYLTAFTLGAGELASQLLLRLPGLGKLTPGTLDMILRSLGEWSVGILFMTSAYFMLTLPVRGRPMLGNLICGAYYLIAFSIRDVANPFDAFAVPFIRSDLVGNGPESGLLASHQILYLSFAATLVLLSILIFMKLEKRAYHPKADPFILLLGVVLALGITGRAWRQFALARTEVLAPTALGLKQSSDLATNEVRSIQVTAYFAPEEGIVQGDVTIDLVEPLPNLSLYVPAGLDLVLVTDCHGENLTVTYPAPEWARVSAPMQLCVSFHGSWNAYRNWYTLRSGYTAEEYNMNVGGYIGQGYLYLSPCFHWFPTAIESFEQAGSYSVQIALPSRYSVGVSPPATVDRDEYWTTYRWHSEQGYPLIMVVAGDYAETSLSDGNLVWAAPEHEPLADQAATGSVEILNALESMIGLEPSPHQIVETPVIRWPVASEGLVILPEHYFTDLTSTNTVSTYEFILETQGPEEAFRREAYYLSRGWMQGHVCVSSTFLPFSIDEVQTTGYEPLQESLAYYLAMQLTDEKFGTNELDAAIQERTDFIELYPVDPLVPDFWLSFSDAGYDSFAGTWTFNAILGGLGQLEKRLGRTQVDWVIGRFIELHQGENISTNSFSDAIGGYFGRAAQQDFENTLSLWKSKQP